MQRLIGLLTVVAMAVVVLAAANPFGVVAQNAPPLPGVGTPVVFPLDADGGEVTITITQVVDPFGAFGGGTPPPDSRYVYVVLTVANGGEQPLDVDPDALFVVDTNGFVYGPSDLFAMGRPSKPSRPAPRSPAGSSSPSRRMPS